MTWESCLYFLSHHCKPSTVKKYRNDHHNLIGLLVDPSLKPHHITGTVAEHNLKQILNVTSDLWAILKQITINLQASEERTAFNSLCKLLSTRRGTSCEWIVKFLIKKRKKMLYINQTKTYFWNVLIGENFKVWMQSIEIILDSSSFNICKATKLCLCWLICWSSCSSWHKQIH